MTAGIEIKDRPQNHSVKPKGMLIDGKWVEAASGARLAVENPARKKPVAEVPRAAAADVELAVAACEIAQRFGGGFLREAEAGGDGLEQGASKLEQRETSRRRGRGEQAEATREPTLGDERYRPCVPGLRRAIRARGRAGGSRRAAASRLLPAGRAARDVAVALPRPSTASLRARPPM